MNDFTKEELERILEGVAWWLDGDSALYSGALINKIQSMIDNYQCKHESDLRSYHPYHDKCIKCGGFY